MIYIDMYVSDKLTRTTTALALGAGRGKTTFYPFCMID